MNEIYLKTCFEKYYRYDRRRKEIEDKIKAIDARMQRIPGSVIKLPEENKTSEHEHRLICDITEKSKLQAKYTELSKPIEEVEDVLQKNPKYSKLLRSKYIDRLTQDEISNKFGYSISGLKKVIDRAILEICSES